MAAIRPDGGPFFGPSRAAAGDPVASSTEPRNDDPGEPRPMTGRTAGTPGCSQGVVSSARNGFVDCSVALAGEAFVAVHFGSQFRLRRSMARSGGSWVKCDSPARRAGILHDHRYHPDVHNARPTLTRRRPKFQSSNITPAFRRAVAVRRRRLRRVRLDDRRIRHQKRPEPTALVVAGVRRLC
jgi:hypothetical protein